MIEEDSTMGTLVFDDIDVGRLGATTRSAYLRQSMNGAFAAQLDMVERRILRIEEALKRAGIDVDALDLLDPRR